MTEVVHCSIEQLEEVLADRADEVVEELRNRLADGLTYIVTEIAAEAPKHSGDFAASVQPYVDEPGNTWSDGAAHGSRAGQPPATGATVEATMREWEPGDEVGAATDAPYSRKLMFHAGRKLGRRRRDKDRKHAYTKKVSPGWVERIVEDANRILEEAG